jgi:molybdopterin molybdotransferase
VVSTSLTLVRRTEDGAVPLAAKYLPITSLGQADGYILVPAASEGYPAGATVAVRPLP